MAVVAVGDFDKAGGRSADQDALRVDSRGQRAEAAAGLRRARPRRARSTRSPPTRKRRRRPSRSTTMLPAARPDDGRRLPAADRRAACSAGCCRRGSQEIAQKPDAPFLGAGAGRGLFVRTKEASIAAGACVKEDGDRARPRRALHRGRARGAVRLHGDRARSAEAEHAARPRARGRREGQRRRPASWPTSTSATSRTGEPMPGIVYEYGLHQRFLPEITLAEVNALAKDWSPDTQPRRRRQRAGEGGRRAAGRGEAGGRDDGGAGQAADGLRRHASSTPPLLDAPPDAGRGRQDDARRPRSASPSGSCRTASRSC